MDPGLRFVVKVTPSMSYAIKWAWKGRGPKQKARPVPQPQRQKSGSLKNFNCLLTFRDIRTSLGVCIAINNRV